MVYQSIGDLMELEQKQFILELAFAFVLVCAGLALLRASGVI